MRVSALLSTLRNTGAGVCFGAAGIAALPMVALAQSANGDFSILDYLDEAEDTRTPAEYALDADKTSAPDEAYDLYNKALSGLTRLQLSDPSLDVQVRRMRSATLDATLRAMLEYDGAKSDRFATRARELVRDMVNDPVDQGWGYWALINARIDNLEPQLAKANLKRAADLIARLDDRHVASTLSRALGDAALRLGDVAYAVGRLLQTDWISGRYELAVAVAAARQASEPADSIFADILDIIASGDQDRIEQAVIDQMPILLESGDYSRVIEVALAVRDASTQGELLREVSDNALAGGSMNSALVASGLNPDAGEATRAWIRIAKSYQEFKYTAQAETAMQAAFDRATGDGGDASDIYQVAKGQFELKHYEAALDVLALLPEQNSDRKDLEIRIAAAMAQAGNASLLSGAIGKVETPEQQNLMIAEQAIQLALGGEAQLALERAAGISDDDERDRVYKKLVGKLLDEDNAQNALSVAKLIVDPVEAADAKGQIAKKYYHDDDAARGDAIFDEALTIPTDTDAKTADKIYRKVAKTLADAGLFDRAEATAENIADAKLQQEAYTNIAGPIAQSDPERGLRLRGLVQEQKYLDAITGSVAYGYFKQGEMLKAQHTAQEIQDDKTRVKMMRKIAEEQSLLLDKYNILRKAEENIPEAVDVSTISPGPSFGTLKIFELEAGKLETGAPVPPNLYVTADSVRADLAPIKPGRAEIALMRNSYYNEKFISAIPGQTLLRKKQGRNSLEFIMIESGTYDLPSLQAHLNAQGYFSKAIVNEGRIFTLRLPLLVMPGAKLVISGADVESLRLSDDRGAFIVNAGTVQIADTIVEAWEEENNQRAYRYYTAKKQFRPFITTWTGGDIDVVGSTIFGLGYLGGKSYGLSMSAGPASITKTRPMFEDAPTGRLIDNSFRNMFYAYYAYEATDAKIVGNELVDNIVYGLDPHDRAQRLLMGLNTAYDTHKKHGLIISREVDYSWFIGNITYENAGSGIMLDRDSTNTLIYANTSFHNEQDGISFFESSCNIVAANEFYNNKRDGIKVRNSWNVGVFDNKISGNGAFGVDTYAAWLDPDGAHVTRDFDLDPYFTFAGVEIVNNDFGDNRSAIKFEGVNGSMIGPNDMSDQSPRLFAGDLASIGGTILTALREKRIPAVANQCAQALPPVDCPYLTAGYLRGEGQGLLPPLDDTGRCIPSSAQAQINAADLVVEDGQDDEPEETVTQ